MNLKALVLNLDYTPITVCTVQRAFLLVFMKKAELIKANETTALHTVDTKYPMPSVIKLGRYISMPYKGVVLSRENVFKRDGYQCQYCGTHKDLTLDHIIPKARGGESNWYNLITACKKCNSNKGNFTPEEAGMKLSMRPYKPSYITYLRDLSGVNYDDWKQFLDSDANTKVA